MDQRPTDHGPTQNTMSAHTATPATYRVSHTGSSVTSGHMMHLLQLRTATALAPLLHCLVTICYLPFYASAAAVCGGLATHAGSLSAKKPTSDSTSSCSTAVSIHALPCSGLDGRANTITTPSSTEGAPSRMNSHCSKHRGPHSRAEAATMLQISRRYLFQHTATRAWNWTVQVQGARQYLSGCYKPTAELAIQQRCHPS